MDRFHHRSSSLPHFGGLAMLSEPYLPFADEGELLDESSDRPSSPDSVTDKLDESRWQENPLPLSLNLPVPGEMQCEVFLPVHYTPGYAYPLLIWLNPQRNVSFVERMQAVSERNQLGLAIDWAGFEEQSPSIPVTARALGLLDHLLGVVESTWHVHPERRILVAEGARLCRWAFRLMRHVPSRFRGIAAIEPGHPEEEREFRIRAPLSGLRKALLVVPASAEASNLPPDHADLLGDEQAATLDSWRAWSHRHQWSLGVALPASPRGADWPRELNSWLMSSIVSTTPA